MRVTTAMAAVTGQWIGTNLLRVMPDDPYRESAATATVGTVAQGGFLTVAYSWADGDDPQDGLLLVGDGPAPGQAIATWVDSWHQSPEWMVLRGTVAEDGGAVHLEGRYSPDAQWRIHLLADGGGWRLAMDNVMPGFDYPAVEATFRQA